MMLVHSIVKKLQNQEFDLKFKMQRKIEFYVFIILGIIGLYFYFFQIYQNKFMILGIIIVFFYLSIYVFG